MKKALAFVLLVGCGDGLTSDVVEQCNVYDEGYSHTVMFCGGQEPENVEDVFVACNVRKSRQEQFEGCVGNVDLMDLHPNGELQHVCVTPWTEKVVTK